MPGGNVSASITVHQFTFSDTERSTSPKVPHLLIRPLRPNDETEPIAAPIDRPTRHDAHGTSFPVPPRDWRHDDATKPDRGKEPMPICILEEQSELPQLPLPRSDREPNFVHCSSPQ